ncbi:MAG: 2'-5' RNA ligase family protein [Myxococcota bacterium]
MQRLFVAIDLPEDVKDELLGLAFGVPNAFWVDPDTLHLTVRYLGEVNGTVAQDLATRLGKLKVEPFPIRLADIGFFPPRGAARTCGSASRRASRSSTCGRSSSTPSPRAWASSPTAGSGCRT